MKNRYHIQQRYGMDVMVRIPDGIPPPKKERKYANKS
jgi:hypothetical protein